MQACPDQAELRAGPWPSYRTWTWAYRMLGACFSLGLTPVDTWSFRLTSVPEPTSLWLVASGLLGLFVYGSRRPSSG